MPPAPIQPQFPRGVSHTPSMLARGASPERARSCWVLRSRPMSRGPRRARRAVAPSSLSLGPSPRRRTPIRGCLFPLAQVPAAAAGAPASGTCAQSSPTGSGADPGDRAAQPASPHSLALAEAEGDGMGRGPGGAGRGEAGPGRATRDAAPASGAPAGGQHPASSARPTGTPPVHAGLLEQG